MKKYFLTTIIIATMSASSASANEVFPDQSITSALSKVSAESVKNLQDCFRSDTELASSKAIRACTKAYKASIPIYDIRSDILTRRGLLQLSAGRFDKASRDFKSAAKLNNINEYAYLGLGYAALLEQDYREAEKYFTDCKSHKKAASLAHYGLGMAKESQGDALEAMSFYDQASKLRPGWKAPLESMARIKPSL